MANPTWPATLPQVLLLEGMQEQSPNVTVRTSMDAGPAKVRRRFSAGVRNFQGRLVLTTEQVETLDVFHQETLLGGAVAFDWTHPRKGTAVAMRIIEPPAYRPLGAGQWETALSLEVLP